MKYRIARLGAHAARIVIVPLQLIFFVSCLVAVAVMAVLFTLVRVIFLLRRRSASEPATPVALVAS